MASDRGFLRGFYSLAILYEPSFAMVQLAAKTKAIEFLLLGEVDLAAEIYSSVD